ncbi:hypothetical protein MMALV_04940 [Candidatus Methanomethylophilus alvi Mx1201]|uniref:Uncharacterized protein n=1 Tax=Methanomethylophilus alvi (strain Mx1201) TaxID=1236689 RepID=M9SA54_METAX|nr:hypothetical protein MMALV_04940 [Candidatus Methanomethylophilus alvi Mx1201]
MRRIVFEQLMYAVHFFAIYAFINNSISRIMMLICVHP